MTKYVIRGGKPLFGEVEISGAKNAAVAIIPAALLVDGVCRIENIPQISDVSALLDILEQLGAKIRFLNKSDVEIDCRVIRTTRAPQELAHKIRASYYLIGALLGRFGEAEVSMPGGCNFGGTRPIDPHVKGFAAMGATVLEATGAYTDTSQQVILCVFKKPRIVQLKAAAMQVDPQAFFVICDAREVLGEGFRPYNEKTPSD